ncbi:MAG: BatD family protein [Pseudomonadota bacterium]
MESDMFIRRSLCLAVMTSLWLSSAVASAATLAMTVDRTTVAAGERVVVEIKAEGGIDSEPKIRNVEAFSIAGTLQSSQFQLINGKMSSSKVYQYNLVPQKPGQFTIGPAVASDGGKAIESNAVTITVMADSNAAGGQAGAPEERDAFISLEVSNQQPYVNEQVIAKLKFASRVPVQNAQLEPSNFEGFWKEQIGDMVHREEVIGGQRFGVNEIRWALFPARAGKIKITPMRIVADMVVPSKRQPSSVFDMRLFGGVGEAQRRAFSTKEMLLDVKETPAEGRPVDFAGLIGKFQIEARASAHDVKVGDSVTLTVTVSGSGNVRDVPEPALANSERFKVYKDQPVTKAAPAEGGVGGSKVFTMAVVPLAEGDIEIAPFSLSFFDPEQKKYGTIATGPTRLKVFPSEKPLSAQPNALPPSGKSKSEVKLVGRDLMPVVRDMDGVRKDGVDGSARIIFMVLALFPVAAFAVVLVMRSRMIARMDVAFVRRNGAMKFARKRVRELRGKGGREFLELSSGILRDFIGDKANIDGRSITPNEVEERLAALGFSAGTLRMAALFLGVCEDGLYGGKMPDDNGRLAMEKRLMDLIKKLDREVL